MKKWVGFVLIFLSTLVILFGLPLLGRRMIDPYSLFLGKTDDYLAKTYWSLRFPRTLIALVAGAGLSSAGMVFQAIFRNSLATPFTLGISSGASFGVAFYLVACPPFFVLGLGGEIWFSLAGTALAMFTVYLLSRADSVSSEQMLLAGVAVSFFFSSMILFMQYLSDQSQMFRMMRWVMGGLADTLPVHLWILVPMTMGIIAVLYCFTRELNLILTGNDRAMTTGVDVTRTRMTLFFLTSLMIGVIVSFCGPIGFVGLMIPHVCRLMTGPDHRRLFPITIWLGGIFLACSDTLARTILTLEEVPVGVLTSLLGGPFFLWLLLRNRSTCQD
ncbi:MAG: iron ABC transporter permease [Planctomycetaceae bacterium]|jgi:iron complex transport system permease protein|nr:iron ABC transporter permease [Planctomycetaceae bacterium]